MKIRRMEERDRAFIMSSWLSSFKSSPYTGPIAMLRYWDVYKREIESLLPWTTVLVATPREADLEDEIHGWVCCEPQMPTFLVHYVYVKLTCRRERVASTLLLAAGLHPRREFAFTYRTEAGDELRKLSGIWAPRIVKRLRRQKEESHEASTR